MKNLVWLVVLVAVVFGGRHIWQNFEQTNAEAVVRKRVEGMLTSAASGDDQTALCQWSKGQLMMSSDEMSGFLDPYTAFARSAGIVKNVTWTVESIDMSASPAVVTVAIGSSKRTLLVGADAPIALKP